MTSSHWRRTHLPLHSDNDSFRFCNVSANIRTCNGFVWDFSIFRWSFRCLLTLDKLNCPENLIGVKTCNKIDLNETYRGGRRMCNEENFRGSECSSKLSNKCSTKFQVFIVESMVMNEHANYWNITRIGLLVTIAKCRTNLSNKWEKCLRRK